MQQRSLRLLDKDMRRYKKEIDGLDKTVQRTMLRGGSMY